MSRVSRRGAAKGADGWAALDTTWDSRAALAAAWLQVAMAVADIGCGLMSLEALLPAGTRYVPIDMVRRDSRTLVVDLACDPIPDVACDAAVLLGVLEYLDDVGPVLRQLTRFPRCVISYNHVSIKDALWVVGLRKLDWRRRHTSMGFGRALRRAGLRITRQRRVRIGERLYEVRPARA